MIAYDSENEKTVGLLLCSQKEHTLYFNLFLIDHEFRNQGIGKKIIDYAITLFPSINEIEVICFQCSIPALCFYQKAGFVLQENVLYPGLPDAGKVCFRLVRPV